MLEGLQGVLCLMDDVLCLMDDVLVYERDREDHDKKLEAVLQRMQSAGVTLNPDKCKFSKDQLKFLGHIINKDGVRADPEDSSYFRSPTSLKHTTDVSVHWNDQPTSQICFKLCLCYSTTNKTT